jgi:hypothetical protein
MRSQHARFSRRTLHIRYPIQARNRGQKITANPFSPTEETLVKALMCQVPERFEERGKSGKRALLIISDGSDNSSR